MLEVLSTAICVTQSADMPTVGLRTQMLNQPLDNVADAAVSHCVYQMQRGDSGHLISLSSGIAEFRGHTEQKDFPAGARGQDASPLSRR
jgi:hypothetical protein